MTELTNEIIENVLRMIRTANSVTQAQSVSDTTKPPPTLFEQLQPGQKLSATVLKIVNENQVILRLAGEKVIAETPLKLNRGQHIQVEVVETGKIPQLRLIGQPSKQDIQAQFLKISLPLQQPLSELVKLLQNTTSPEADSSLDMEIKQWLKQIPTVESLKNPQAFRDTLSGSGLFLEAALAKGQKPPVDVKTALFRIAERLRTQLQTAKSSENTAVSDKTVSTQKNVTAETRPATSSLSTSSTSTGTTKTTPLSDTVQPTVKNTVTAPGPGRPASAIPNTATAERSPVAKTKTATETTSSVTTTKTVTGNAAVATPNKTPAVPNSGTPPGKAVSGNAKTDVLLQARILPQSHPRQTSSATPASTAVIPETLKAETAAKNPFAFFRPEMKDRVKPQHVKSREMQTLLAHTAKLANVLKQVESSIARIQTQQLASVPQDDNTRQVWQFEIPIRQADEVNDFLVRIEQDDSQNENDELDSSWTISLNFKIAQSGRIHSKLKLTGENLSTHFWAEKEQTASKIRQYLPRLQTALEKTGLTVTRMTASNGKPPDPVILPRPESFLVDENA